MTLTKRAGIWVMLVALIISAGVSGASAAQPPRVVRITASRWHFTPNRITLKRGEPVTLELTSTDAVHGFMIQAFNIDTDVPRGKILPLTITPARAGTFTAICDHYCGLGHGFMKLKFVVK